ncbi:putative lyase [Helianthus anomalus]
MTEARWFNSGYTPTFNEFLNNAYMSIGLRGGSTLQEGVFVGIRTSKKDRGDHAPKSIQCYMHESGSSEVEARECIKELIVETWKKLNKEPQAIGSELPLEFIECVRNLARMRHFMYTEGDKHGKPDMFKPYALSLFVDPILGLP